MAADRSYIAENDRERRRLEALVGKFDDAALSRTMPDGWTVAGVLAHLAFWDERIVTFIELLKRGAKVPGGGPDRRRVDQRRREADAARAAAAPSRHARRRDRARD